MSTIILDIISIITLMNLLEVVVHIVVAVQNVVRKEIQSVLCVHMKKNK